ncbi:hypothetical protein BSL78_18528 [Apostichopus japonicus]|uniref:DNA 3'-5' helicase n=1 Tax=Stichopus japonicus TaxID=307972 RepID=A0A2G8K9E2_STIJA|nr:hypothetical protein BSL78_18528 [Apostichopus japonicus]
MNMASMGYFPVPQELLHDCIRKTLEKVPVNISFEQLLPEQIRCIENVVNGKDTFLMLPTGSGKTLPFQIVSSVVKELRQHDKAYQQHFPSQPIVIVVSPLLSLMRSHVREMHILGISSASLNSPEDERIKLGHFEVVLGSPESWLNSTTWREVLLTPEFQQRIICLVTDEVHCVPKWGLQGRKKAEAVFWETFGRLGELRTLLPEGTPILAMTATATKKSRRMIYNSLCLRSPEELVSSPDRKNVKLSIRKIPTVAIIDGEKVKLEPSEQFDHVFKPLVEDIVTKKLGSDLTIIYCRTVKECGEVYEYFSRELGSEGYSFEGAARISANRLFAMFHHSTPDEIKNDVLKSLIDDGHYRLIIATNALGMGINARHVRRVFNVGIPEDIEAYIQEIGRAGRDGQRSHAILFYKSFHLLQADETMKSYARNTSICRRALLMKQFQALKRLNLIMTVVIYVRQSASAVSVKQRAELTVLLYRMSHKRSHLLYSSVWLRPRMRNCSDVPYLNTEIVYSDAVQITILWDQDSPPS